MWSQRPAPDRSQKKNIEQKGEARPLSSRRRRISFAPRRIRPSAVPPTGSHDPPPKPSSESHFSAGKFNVKTLDWHVLHLLLILLATYAS